jgi:cell cycle sensor histidine kinase DivJ
MGELPELAVAMDAQGRTEAVFGQALPGMLLDALHKGLAEVAAPADRGAVQAAISEAMDHGAATVQFILAGGGQAVVTSLQRTRVGGLTAILRPASAAPSDETIGRPDASLSAADVARRLSEADAARRHAEAERDRAEANAKARTRFVANMSHELRTPLNAIMGFSDMMRTKVFGELAPKYAEYADLIHESGGHLLDLINDVLDMSKIDADRYVLSREVFDIREPLNAALRLIRLQADDAGVKLRAILPSEPLVVDADRRALKQVVLNLLSNAVKFTPKDGTVILTVRAALDAPSVLEIIVADTGVGIAKDDLQRLGRPFEQAGDMDQRGRGTGLGLALVAAFAKLHGGVLVLESRLGEGTAATVRLPALLATKTASSDGTRELTDAAAEPRDLKPAAEPHGTILQPAPVSPSAPLGFRVGEAGTDQSTSPRLTLVHSAPLSASLGPAAFSPKPGAQFDEVPPA